MLKRPCFNVGFIAHSLREQYFRISCVKGLLWASTCYGWMPVRIRLAKYDRTIYLVEYSDEHPPAFLKSAGFQYFKRADRM